MSLHTDSMKPRRCRHGVCWWSILYWSWIASIWALFIFFMAILSGCSTPGSWVDNINPFSGEDPQVEEVPADPIKQASGHFVRWGTLLIIGGIVYAVFTRAATGWGINAALAGTIMISLSWLFAQPWLPWIGLITLILYAGWKVYNRLNPELETEPLYK